MGSSHILVLYKIWKVCEYTLVCSKITKICTCHTIIQYKLQCNHPTVPFSEDERGLLRIVRAEVEGAALAGSRRPRSGTRRYRGHRRGQLMYRHLVTPLAEHTVFIDEGLVLAGEHLILARDGRCLLLPMLQTPLQMWHLVCLCVLLTDKFSHLREMMSKCNYKKWLINLKNSHFLREYDFLYFKLFCNDRIHPKLFLGRICGWRIFLVGRVDQSKEILDKTTSN